MLRETNKRRPLSGAIQSLIVGVLTVTAALLSTLGTRATPSEPTEVEWTEAANEAQGSKVNVTIRVVLVSKKFFARLYPDLKVGGQFKLDWIDAVMLLEAVQGDRKAHLRQTPDIAVSQGKWASYSWDDAITLRNTVSVKTLVAQDRRSLDLELNAKIGKAQVTKSVRLYHSHTAGFVVDSSADQVTFLLATPQIVTDGKGPADGKRAGVPDQRKPEFHVLFDLIHSASKPSEVADKPEWRFLPKTVSFGQVKARTESVRWVLLRGFRPCRIVSVSETDNQLQVYPTQNEPSTSHLLSITLNPSQSGVFSRNIRVQTDLQTGGEIEFNIQADVLP